MNWIILKSLHELYTTGRTQKKDTVLKNPYVQYLLNSTKELFNFKKEIVANKAFHSLYESKFLDNYLSYHQFLSENDLLKPQTRFEESDIKILMDLDEGMKSGDLLPVRDQILANEETVRGVSFMFFKNEKYLGSRESLLKAVKKFLQIDSLADDKDQQYKYVLECKDPKCIVLCENINFLKKPSFPRANNIELWYVGGMNINKLDFSDTRGLPIFYSGDWDYHGLFEIYRLVKDKISAIQLLTPNGSPKGIIETEHKSHWRGWPEEIDNLLNVEQRNLLKTLIKKNQWIIEESNDFKLFLDQISR